MVKELNELGKEYSSSEIQQIIPHRAPFLLVDRITEQDGDRVAGYKNVTANEPFFAGHFPPPLEAVMPGVLILEAMAQLSAFLVRRDGPEMGYLVGIDNARFRRKVVPGDRLALESRLVRRKLHLLLADARATVDGELAASATLSILLLDGESHDRK